MGREVFSAKEAHAVSLTEGYNKFFNRVQKAIRDSAGLGMQKEVYSLTGLESEDTITRIVEDLKNLGFDVRLYEGKDLMEISW